MDECRDAYIIFKIAQFNQKQDEVHGESQWRAKNIMLVEVFERDAAFLLNIYRFSRKLISFVAAMFFLLLSCIMYDSTLTGWRLIYASLERWFHENF